MLDGNDLLIAIKKAALDAVNTSQPSDFCFGKVISVSPLKISVEQKLTFGIAQLILTRNVTDYTIPVTIDWKAGSALAIHNHQVSGSDNRGDSINFYTQDADLNHQHDIKGTNEIIIHNALKINEDVVLLKQKGGQKYLVVDRVVNA